MDHTLYYYRMPAWCLYLQCNKGHISEICVVLNTVLIRPHLDLLCPAVTHYSAMIWPAFSTPLNSAAHPLSVEFWILYGGYCHQTVPECGRKSSCSQTLGKGIHQTRGLRSAYAHTPPYWALLPRARIDASTSTHKYVASASEPQTCPHSRMKTPTVHK